MILDRWRARRAIMTRTPPTSVEDQPNPALVPMVRDLSERLVAPFSLGDPIWHQRWEGELQVLGLDALTRSVSDVRQRLARTGHELALRHMARRGRRVFAVILCAPVGDEGLVGWHSRLQDDQGEVGPADWRAASRLLSVLAVGVDGEHQLFGGDGQISAAVSAWAAAQGNAG
ncbi:MAG: hypothetical protein ACI9EF_002829 [Pseudohongiellaceae bacterium]|jgi:hypothetical protein